MPSTARGGGATTTELLLITSDSLHDHKGVKRFSQHNDFSTTKNHRSVICRAKLELKHPCTALLIFGQAYPQQVVVAFLGPGFKMCLVATHL